MFSTKRFFLEKRPFLIHGESLMAQAFAFILRYVSGRISVYCRNCTSSLKKFLPRKLQFIRGKTRVSCRINCSSVPRNFFKTREQLFESMARTALKFHGFQMLHRDDYQINLLFFGKIKLLNKRKTDSMSYFVCLFAKKLQVVFLRPSASLF